MADEKVMVESRHVSLDSKEFVVLREIAKIIAEGTMWNKSARIVLEYDPQKERMRISTFMKADEAGLVADRILDRA